MTQDSTPHNENCLDANTPQVDELRTDFSVSMFDHSDLAFGVLKLHLDEQGEPYDWTFAYANDAMGTLLGTTRDALTGNRFYELFPWADRKWLDFFRKPALEGENLEFEEISEGVGCYLHVNATTMGMPGYLNVTLRDVREEVKLRKDSNKALQEALIASERANNAKSNFLTSMSHDIRTPMNAIVGFTALAQTHMDNTEQVQDYLAKINTSSTHLLSLINDILDMSRIESGSVKLDEKPVHMPDLLHDLRTINFTPLQRLKVLKSSIYKRV